MVRIVQWILNHPKVSFVLLIILTVYFSFKLPKLELNAREEAMLPPSDPEIVLYYNFLKEFGSDDILYVFFPVEDLFEYRTIRLVDRLTRKFSEIRHVEQVLSFTNFQTAYNKDDALVIGSLEEELPTLALADLPALRKRILSDPLYHKALLVSPDGRVAIIGLRLRRLEASLQGKEVVGEVRKILEKEQQKGNIQRVYIGGSTYFQVALGEAYERDTQLLTPIMISLVLLVLLMIFRNPFVSLIPLLIVVVNLVWTFGFVVVIGRYITPITEVILPLLLVYGVLIGVHFISRYRVHLQGGSERKIAILQSVDEVGMPCFYTAVTTGLGFGAFTVSPLPVIKDLGVYAAFGIASNFVLMFSLLPLLLFRVRSFGIFKGNGRFSFLHDFLQVISRFIFHYRNSILMGLSCLFILFGVWISRITIDTNTLKFFKEYAEVVEVDRVGRNLVGGWAPLEFWISVRGNLDLRDPEVLLEIEQFQEYLESLSPIDKSLSLVDILKKGNQEVHGGSPSHYEIPRSSIEVARLLEFLGFVGGEKGLASYLKSDLKQTRLTAWSEIMPSKQSVAVFQEIKDYIEKNISDKLDVHLTGIIWLGQRLLSQILSTEIRSFSLAFILIFVFLIFSFRSLKMAIIALPTNLFPVVITLGMMGLLKINLDIGTCTVASIVIAMAVDDTIHFLHRFREEIREHENYGVAIQQTMEKVGPPIVYTSLVLAAGFWVLIFSSYVPALNFGFLSGVAVLAALIGDILILPALLLQFKPIKMPDIGDIGREKQPLEKT